MASNNNRLLLAIIELGGYPDFRALYTRLGFEVVIESSMRKALTYLKRHTPDVIVAEFNLTPDFRDRISSLESLIAVAQRDPDIRLVVFYESQFEQQFARLKARYPFYAELAFPIRETELERVLKSIGTD